MFIVRFFGFSFCGCHVRGSAGEKGLVCSSLVCSPHSSSFAQVNLVVSSSGISVVEASTVAMLQKCDVDEVTFSGLDPYDKKRLSYSTRDAKLRLI